MSLQFNKLYFVLFLLLLAAEFFIGIYLHDAIIRPYGGDFLVVMLLYCFVKSFCRINVLPAAIGVLIFAYAIEVSQYFHLVNLLGWGNSKTARMIMGTSFAWTDIWAYTLGICCVLIIEKTAGNRKGNNAPAR